MYDKLALYYDTLYRDKDYKMECSFIKHTFGHCKVKPKTILDVGCGTGTHSAILTDMGYNVHGIDLSPEMIRRAKKKYPSGSFDTADVRVMIGHRKNDAVISMFGTMAYLTEPSDLSKALKNVNRTLSVGGVFIFDGWNSFAVARATPPKGKLVRVDNLFKYTELLPYNRYIGTFKYTLIDILRSDVIEHEEAVCLFTKNMIGTVLEDTGFELVFYWALFSPGISPTVEDWKVSVVARKVQDA